MTSPTIPLLVMSSGSPGYGTGNNDNTVNANDSSINTRNESPKDVHQIRQDFMQLLRETSSVSSNLSWPDTKDSLKQDPRYQAVRDDTLLEKWFNEFRKKRQDFMQLLRETSCVSSHSSWEDTKDSFKEDPRFQAVGDDALSEDWFNEFRQVLIREDFMQLLRETSWVSSHVSWRVTKDSLKWDPRFRAVGDDKLSEEWFNEFRQNLIREDFMQLLRETSWVSNHYSWQDTKDSLKRDPRFQAVGDDKLAEKWFIEVRQDLIRQDFMQLLRETPWIHSQSSWDVTREALQLDQFKAAADVALFEKLFIEFKKPLKRHDFMQLLRDTPGVRSSSWEEAKKAIEGDQRYVASGDVADEKKWFHEFKKSLPFKKLLHDTPGIERNSSWQIAKEVLKSKKQFLDEQEDALREECFNEFKMNMVVTFGGCREQLSDAITHGQLALKHNLLKEYETPSNGPFAVYKVDDFIDRINFAVEGYYNMEYQATGNFKILSIDQIDMSFRYIASSESTVEIKSLGFEPKYGLTNDTKNGHAVYKYDVLRELEHYNLTDVFDNTLDVTLTASLHSFRVLRKGAFLCLRIQINIEYSDIDFNGEVDIELQTTTTTAACQRMNINATDAAMCDDNSLYFPVLVVVGVTCVLDGLSVFTGLIMFCKYCGTFETKSLAAISLFSLMYGDDILGTVTSVHYENAGSEIYLKLSVIIVIYSFVILFTLLALNLIIALINTSYTTVNEIDQKDDEDGETVSMFCFLNGEEVQKRPERFHIWWYGERYKSCCCNSCFET
ncbi:uncharacterized protein LOC127844884 isoform X2 [Dreissena polymorpha]|uniref:uncharacterized protein LOC127844884 isoform X2 n=1 Tax=Dreissena polymorpha TaxID=45954 RepID=UPI0022651C33|nr:uncharacterized protein LOC127844884 isoform X2 [Dreissena polymorpha]